MDAIKYIAVLMVFCTEGGETGGHGGKHHDHVKLHVPEFIHHDHHTKVVTIHHHHHKPKKEHHHHHHHHHHKKPHIPHGHHYHHHKNSHSIKTTVTKHGGHGHHKHHGHGHHAHHGHQGHHGHHSHNAHHGHGHHHDTPSYSYDPSAIPSFEKDFGSPYPPSISHHGGGIVPQTPQVHGVSHTVKEVKVFDSLPGVIPTNTRSHGYEVTEEGEDTDDDVFSSVNGIQQAFPATFGYLRGAAAQPSAQNAFAPHATTFTPQINTHDPFASSEALPADFTGEGFQSIQNRPLAPDLESFGISNGQPSADFPVVFQGSSGVEDPHSFAGAEGDGSPFAADQGSIDENTPVSFAREAGIQHSSNIGGVETLVY